MHIDSDLGPSPHGIHPQGMDLPVDPDHLTVQSGAGAIIDNLFWCIGASGSGVLIPRPFYPAFDNDLEV